MFPLWRQFVDSERVSAYRAWHDAIAFCLVLVGGIEAFYAGKPWRVYLPYLFAGLFFFVLGEKGPKIKAKIIDIGPWGRLRRVNKQQAAELANALKENSELRDAIAAPSTQISSQLSLPSLEIRPSPGEAVTSFVEKAHGETHFRMDIYNPPPEKAHNVQVTLVKIDPLPISEYFRARADFPYHARLGHLADGSVDSATGHDINPGTSKQFELLYFWKSSDGRIMTNGIDTKQALSRNAWFSIEDKEYWHLKYEVSSARNGIQRPMFFVRREGESLFMSRLV